MKPRIEKEAARMRCQNTEIERRRVWREIHRKQDAGEMSAREAAQRKADFWAQRRADLERTRAS